MDGKLVIDWPITFGINGIVEPAGEWMEDSFFSIRHEPVAFPYKILEEQISDNVDFNKVIINAGLTRQFHTAQSSIERVALICLALARPDLYVS